MVLETAAIPPDARLDTLRATMGGLFDMDILRTPASECLVSMRAVEMGEVTLVDIELAGAAIHHARRSDWHCRRDDADYVLVQVCRQGQVRGEADGQPFVHGAGGVLITDMARTSQTWSGDASSTGLTLPRALVRRHVPGFEALHGVVLNSEPASVLGEHIVSLSRHVEKIAPDVRPMIAEASLAMLSRLLTPQSPLGEEARRLKPSVQLYKALRFVEARYCDPSLDAAAISLKLRIPRSSLYRLFEPLGGVRRHILTLRLRQAFTMLSDPAESRSIAGIAFDLGFKDAGHFSRAFKARHGVTPRDLRAVTREATAQNGSA